MFEGGGEESGVLFTSIDDSPGSHGRPGMGGRREEEVGDSLLEKEKGFRKRGGGGGRGQRVACLVRSATQ